MRNDVHVLGVIEETEKRFGPGAVGVGAACGEVVQHNLSLSKRAKEERVNDAVFVTLATDELVKGRPDLGDDAQLLALLLFFVCTIEANLSVELTAYVAESALTNEGLQDVCLSQKRRSGHAWNIKTVMKYNCLIY